MKADADLVAEALAGGSGAFRPILDRYQDAVFGIALTRLRDFHEAEDVAQEVFIDTFERLDSLKDPSRLAAWLRSVTIHHCIDVLRRRREGVDIEKAGAEASTSVTPEVEFERRELGQRVMAAIGKLSKTQRETMTLFYVGDYSIQDVAKMQEVPVGTVKRRLHDGREKLRTGTLEMFEGTLKADAPKSDFGDRVFELLCRHDRPAVRWPWKDIEEELRRIGVDGVGGFTKAMQLPHAPTRGFALHFSRLMHDAAGAADDKRREAVVEALKSALHDSCKGNRALAAVALLHLDVDSARKRDEFLPLVLLLLQDPTRLVRGRVAYELWERAADAEWAAQVPLEATALALADEEQPMVRHRMAQLVRRIVEARWGQRMIEGQTEPLAGRSRPTGRSDAETR